MLYALIKSPVDALARWAEKWSHRLRGHMVLSIVYPNGYHQTEWVTDVYTSPEDGRLWADVVGWGPEPLNFKHDITITGA